MSGKTDSAAPIRRLPDALIDQIAAGEVVERPASVVKELVENALDAGASRVRVEVRGGGRDWIAVADDGRGMTPDDARLALQRHATSKIAAADDLMRIDTYGFRGEALPAIASVSDLRLRTRLHGAPTAFELHVRGGAVLGERSLGAPEGTRIEVADLFATVPARRKFLKTDMTEWGHIADWLARSALALPAVHFEIRRDDRAAQVWPSARSTLDRIAAVLGEKEAEALIAVHHEEGRAQLSGFVSRPDRHRGTPAGIHLFVNRRPVRDRVLQHALVDVYRDLLPRGRFPSAVLFLDVPSEAVDVNVHPAKWEVRFADPRWAHRLVRSAALEAIREQRWLAPGADLASGAGAASSHSSPMTSADATPRPVTTDWIFAGPDGSQPGAARETPEGGSGFGPTSDLSAPIRFGELRLLGQLLATYLLVEAKDRLLLIDQHAAHERVLYERLRAGWLERTVEVQGLLAPLSVQLEPRAFAALAEALEDAAGLGFDLEIFGDDAFAVRGVPALLADRDPASLVRGLADELAAGPGGVSGAAAVRALDAADRIFASLACHAARRKGDALEGAEQRALLDALDTIPWAPTCPHGRPVTVPLEIAEIERRFARR